MDRDKIGKAIKVFGYGLAAVAIVYVVLEYAL